MVNNWIVDANGVFICGGFYEPTPGPGQQVVTLPGETMPDLVNERYDATTPTKCRPATAMELDAAQATKDSQSMAALRAQHDPLVRAIVSSLANAGVSYDIPQELLIDRVHAAIQRHQGGPHGTDIQ